MGEEHQHTWSPIYQGDRGDLDEEELEFDEEEVKYRFFLESPEGRRGLELAKEQNPDFVAMVTEWCIDCPLRRGVKYEEEEDNVEEEEVMEEENVEEGWWDSTEKAEDEEEEEKEEEDLDEEGEEEESETKKGKSDLNAEESKRGDEEAVQQTETDHSTLNCKIQQAYWQPWEVEEVEEKSGGRVGGGVQGGVSSVE